MEPPGNLGSRPAALRRVGGAVAFAAAAAAAAWMVSRGVARPWRLAVFPAFAFALSGLEQARTRV